MPVIRNPERTKNSSTPIQPLSVAKTHSLAGSESRCSRIVRLWSMTTSTATPRSPSSAGYTWRDGAVAVADPRAAGGARAAGAAMLDRYAASPTETTAARRFLVSASWRGTSTQRRDVDLVDVARRTAARRGGRDAGA